MRNYTKKAFTLVELLVVITILAIISVVAYQNFGWAVDKAVSWRKINDITTIESALQQYKVDKNSYPKVDAYSTNNLWGYTWSTYATPSNKIIVELDWEEVQSLTWTINWGWKVYWTWSIGQIWWKWTISRDTLGKRYISSDLYDPEVWDIKVNDIGWWDSWKMIDLGIWRYVYAVYKKPKWDNYDWSSNKTWDAYNLAFTVKETWTDQYITKIVWDYDEESCYDNKDLCPSTLIWSLSWTTVTPNILIDWTVEDWDSNLDYYWVPYAAKDFAEQ